MVDYITKARLVEIGHENLTESRLKVEKAAARNVRNATFLSHSSKDDDAMPGVVAVLENHGASVYLDKKDPALSSQTPHEIAKTLRSRITDCRKFIVFATNNTKDSKWVPWELGLADGYKHASNVCIFPGPDKASDRYWMEQEYFGNYERIVWGKFKNESDFRWMVWNHVDNSAIALRGWLEQN